MDKKKKKLGGRPRLNHVRLVLRLPETFIKQMQDMGNQLALDTPQAAARHFLTLGMQSSMGSLSSSRSADISQLMVTTLTEAMQALPAQLMAMETDMFSGKETVIVDAPRPAKRPSKRARVEAAGGRSTTMLDTKRLNRNGAGSRKRG